MPNHPHRRRPNWIDWRPGYIGKPALSNITGLPIQHVWSNLSQWRHNGTVYEYSGPPDAAINGDATADGEFHFVLRSPDKIDASERRLGIVLLYWPIDTRATTVKVDWHDPHDGAAVNLFEQEGEQQGVSGYGTYLNPSNAMVFYDSVTYDPDEAAWRHVAIKVDNMQVATLSVFHMAEESLPSEQVQITPGNMASGRVIRGYDGTEAGSLGRAMHNVGLGAADTDHESIESVTRKVLFQEGWPVGCHHDWGAAQWDNPFNLGTFTTSPRHLVNNDDREAYPLVIVGQIDTGVQIRYTSTTTGDTWTYTHAGAGVAWDTPTVINYTQGTGGNLGAGRGLEIDGDAWDEITIEVFGQPPGLGGDEIVFRDVALFEDEAWD